MREFNTFDIYSERLEEINLQIKIAGKKKDKRTIAKLAAERKRLQELMQSKGSGR